MSNLEESLENAIGSSETPLDAFTQEEAAQVRRFVATDRRVLVGTSQGDGEGWSVGTVPYARITGVTIRVSDPPHHLGKLLGVIVAGLGALLLAAGGSVGEIPASLGGLLAILAGAFIWVLSPDRENELELKLRCASRENLSFDLPPAALGWCETVAQAVGDYQS